MGVRYIHMVEREFVWNPALGTYTREVNGRLERGIICGSCDEPLQPGEKFVVIGPFSRVGPLRVHDRCVPRGFNRNISSG